VIFEGSIGHKKLPLSLFEALAELPQSVSLTVAGYVNPGSEEHMGACLRAVARLGLQERVHFRGLLQRHELAEAVVQHDVGLLLIDASANPDDNLRTLVGASNKVYEYLAAGLPVIVPDTPDWHEALVGRGLAIGCNASSPQSIGSALRFFLDSPTTLRRMGERGRCMIRDTWNYENVFRPVLERMEASVG
jgi:glycosyltransferase involved in cell wall biosynthesis